MLARRNQIPEMQMALRRPDAIGAAPSHDSLLEIFWRQKSGVATTVIPALLLASAYLLLATPLYTGSATLYVRRGTPKLIGQAISETPTSDDGSFLYRS